MDNKLLYCNSLTKYSRFKTRVVNVGKVKIGGDNPIVIQGAGAGAEVTARGVYSDLLRIGAKL